MLREIGVSSAAGPIFGTIGLTLGGLRHVGAPDRLGDHTAGHEQNSDGDSSHPLRVPQGG